MSFFNMFGNNSPSAAIVHPGGKGMQQAGAPRGQQASQQQTTTSGDPADKQVTTKEPSSPLDTLTSFWDTPKDAEGKPIAPVADPTSSDIFTLDPEKVTASAKKLNFTAGISPELAAKALGGDAAALSEAINTAVQAAVAAMTVNTSKMINQSHATNNTRVKQALPRTIKEVQLGQAGTNNPVLEHPAVQPLVNAMKAAAFAKDPNADPVKVTKDVEAYITGLGTAVTANSPEALSAANKKQAAETNWMEYIK